MTNPEQLEAIWRQHSGKILGAAAGLAFGLFVYWFGLLWTLFILATTLVGYWIGARIDFDIYELPEWLERIISPKRR